MTKRGLCPVIDIFTLRFQICILYSLLHIICIMLNITDALNVIFVCGVPTISECQVQVNACVMSDDAGVVRSICTEDKTIYILTPVEPSVLERVNCIQCGAVGLPKCLRITQEVHSNCDVVSEVYCHLIILSIAPVKSRMVYLSGASLVELTQVVLEKRSLNGCSSSDSSE